MQSHVYLVKYAKICNIPFLYLYCMHYETNFIETDFEYAAS